MGSFLAGPPISAAGEDMVMESAKFFGGARAVGVVVSYNRVGLAVETK
jgi:hypothetical protein